MCVAAALWAMELPLVVFTLILGITGDNQQEKRADSVTNVPNPPSIKILISVSNAKAQRLAILGASPQTQVQGNQSHRDYNRNNEANYRMTITN